MAPVPSNESVQPATARAIRNASVPVSRTIAMLATSTNLRETSPEWPATGGSLRVGRASGNRQGIATAPLSATSSSLREASAATTSGLGALGLTRWRASRGMRAVPVGSAASILRGGATSGLSGAGPSVRNKSARKLGNHPERGKQAMLRQVAHSLFGTATVRDDLHCHDPCASDDACSGEEPFCDLTVGACFRCVAQRRQGAEPDITLAPSIARW